MSNISLQQFQVSWLEFHTLGIGKRVVGLSRERGFKFNGGAIGFKPI